VTACLGSSDISMWSMVRKCSRSGEHIQSYHHGTVPEVAMMMADTVRPDDCTSIYPESPMRPHDDLHRYKTKGQRYAHASRWQ